MTLADKRIIELLDKWLTSLDLHLKYADLSDADYAIVQSWPKHDRPTRWIIELARQKTLELKALQDARIEMGDGKFAESLELMAFLANLVGSEHVQRFIPLAGQNQERPAPETPSAASPQGETTATMPLPRPRSARPPVKPAKKSAATSPTDTLPVTGPALEKKILADAVRLLKWGRKWHELAELIARIADRPPVGEVRRILRSRKAEIELQAENEE